MYFIAKMVIIYIFDYAVNNFKLKNDPFPNYKRWNKMPFLKRMLSQV